MTTARAISRKATGTAKRDVTVKPAGSISGKITRTDGAKASTIQVFAIGPEVTIGQGEGVEWAYGSFATPNDAGTYRFRGLPAGTYSVHFSDENGKLLSQCYNDVVPKPSFDLTCPSSATTIRVKGGDAHTLDDQVLSRVGGTYKGTVTSTSGKPIKGITITPSAVGSKKLSAVQATDSRSTGRFAMNRLGYGDWQFVAADLSGTWETTWFNSRTRAGAKTFTSTEGATISGLNFKLRSNASVKTSAKVSGKSAKVAVSITQRSTGAKVGGQVTVSTGSTSKAARLSGGKASVTLKGLKPGDHRIKVVYKGTSSTANAARYVTVKVK